MINSIETIWKAGFLDEKSLVAPKINDLYNQKSRHLVERIKTMFRVNLLIIITTAIIFPVIYYFMGFFWHGIVASIVLLLYAWYYNQQVKTLRTLDQGSTSLDYLKSFDIWLKDVFSRSIKIARFSYPLFFLIALSIMWSAWNRQDGISKIKQKYPDMTFVGNIPLFVILIAAVSLLCLYLFSAKLCKWEVRLMYGRIFDKLKETISEMEKLRK